MGAKKKGGKKGKGKKGKKEEVKQEETGDTKSWCARTVKFLAGNFNRANAKPDTMPYES